jgi:hypothetical protein
MHLWMDGVWVPESLEARALLSTVAAPESPTPLAEVQAVPSGIATTTVLQASTKLTGSGARVTLTAKVGAAHMGRSVNAGSVHFAVVSASPEPLGRAHLNKLGEARITTSRLKPGSSYEVEAEFVPSVRGYATSSDQLTLSVGRPEVTSFQITAAHYFGAPGTPVTFSVTAVDRQMEPVTSFTGTIHLVSPTNRQAKLVPSSYSFTTADQGSHTFVDGVTFHKGGAEVLKVAQVNNTRIRGKATFGIE